MGMPCVGAEYLGKSRHRLLEGARCAVCGRPATNSHHIVPKGLGGGSRGLQLGPYSLRSPLIALCGSGNASGCHGAAHRRLIRFRWVWDDPANQDRWFALELPDELYHDNNLHWMRQRVNELEREIARLKQ